VAEFNLLDFGILVFLGLAGGVAGYLLRRLEKFEEASDTFRSLTLTQISAAANLLLASIDHFKNKKIVKEDLFTIFESIDGTLKKQIFEQSGVALLEEDKRKRITDFYFEFLTLSKASKSIYSDEDDLRTKFTEPGQEIGTTSLSKITEMVNQVQSDLDNELKCYRWKLPLIMMTLVGLLAVVSAIIAYIQSIISGA